MTLRFDRSKAYIGIGHVCLKDTVDTDPSIVGAVTLSWDLRDPSHKRMASVRANDKFAIKTSVSIWIIHDSCGNGLPVD